MATEYGTEFFDLIREGCKASAEAVVPAFLPHYRPKSVVDVGCGEGWWGKAFEDAGCEVVGYDSGDVEPVIPHHAVDLSKPVEITSPSKTFDLAVCLEVAEHLPPEVASGFVAELCRLAPVVLFSAAIPGQGGHGHLNEQWPAYWVDLFEENDYMVTGDFRLEIWDDDRIENWYRQNMLIACRRDLRRFSEFRFCDVLPLVHPVLYDARRG